MPEPLSRLSAVLANPRPVLRNPLPAIPLPRPNSGRHSAPKSGLGSKLKMGFDFAAALVMLVAALPVMIACIVLVRLTSKGPAIYTQQRVGRGGRVFTLLKIRTMYHECESLTGPRWCMPGDPRITPVGKVLRKLHLDELPQVWNVLRGEMSMIGPRPERPEICRKLRNLVPGYDRRHAVRPGITGFAQIHLPPDTCVRSVKNKVAYDLFYIRHRTAWRELSILVCTAMKMLGLKALYHRPPRCPTDEVE